MIPQYEEKLKEKMRSNDRIFVLKLMPGKKGKTTSGFLDQRLFVGENTLHAKMNTMTCLWYLEYENGILPLPLKQQFTSFAAAKKFVEDYYKRRNVEIVEVID